MITYNTKPLEPFLAVTNLVKNTPLMGEYCQQIPNALIYTAQKGQVKLRVNAIALIQLRNWNDKEEDFVGSGLFYEQPPSNQRRINEAGKCIMEKYSLLNDIKRWRSCSDVPRGCVNRIRLLPLRRVDHSGVLIGAGETWRSGWPSRVLANDVSTRIDRQPAREERSIARVQRQVVASCYRTKFDRGT